jgi:CHASE2 domain-containing sensor protein
VVDGVKRLLVALLAALHIAVQAAPNSDPLDLPLRQYLLIFGLAMLGGLVSFYAKVRAGTVAAWNVFHLIGELATSAFAGLMAFYVCTWIDLAPLLTAALVGAAGHMGARAISAFENWAQDKAKKL